MVLTRVTAAATAAMVAAAALPRHILAVEVAQEVILAPAAPAALTPATELLALVAVEVAAVQGTTLVSVQLEAAVLGFWVLAPTEPLELAVNLAPAAGAVLVEPMAAAAMVLATARQVGFAAVEAAAVLDLTD